MVNDLVSRLINTTDDDNAPHSPNDDQSIFYNNDFYLNDPPKRIIGYIYDATGVQIVLHDQHCSVGGLVSRWIPASGTYR
jgi:hypothetical protein